MCLLSSTRTRKALQIFKMWQSHTEMETLRFPLRLEGWQRGLALCYHDNVSLYNNSCDTEILAHCPASTPPPQSSLYLLALYVLLSWILYSTLTKTQGPVRAAGPWDWSVGQSLPLRRITQVFSQREQGRGSNHLDVPHSFSNYTESQRCTPFSSAVFSNEICLFPYVLRWLRNISLCLK